MKQFINYSVALLLFLTKPAATVFAQDDLDVKILRELAEDRTKSQTGFYQTLSHISSPVCMAVPVSLFVTGMIKHDATLKRNALYIAKSYVASQIITWGMKLSVNRPRPYITDPSVDPIAHPSRFSFPSGHTSEAFATATSVSIVCPKWYVIVPSFAFASMVGYSRMYLGAHYPTDVIVGAAVGSGSAWLMHKMNKWIQGGKQRRKLMINDPVF